MSNFEDMKRGPKVPNPVDIEVGERIKTRRRILGMSQGKLAEALGVTFQQVQKYKKGKNRVGASRLQNVATIFGVPFSYFFPDQSSGTEGDITSNPGKEITAFLANNEGLDLNRAFALISSPLVRKRVVGLVKSISEAGLGEAGSGG
ncbi:helix-turn-helix transcriptional regulator [Agrobacterium vitis]|nr:MULTISPECIES: helix-turn-helix transcriptional regulator [Rhizobium/Agrobacterium group]MCF1475410.1 helix-turn-helix transcriptional regulator [Allorhizobium ampelinum]MCF1485688.1 helix-turn-helix transcriptional regulator [Allorhizobium ampelinum]MVA73451.1 helix-turn-helix domain-containing protein [Agrobacterium vitis]QZO07277.1 helix-turn-helix domain-containing protein [Agrobacterium vitis]UJL91039.1 helix-turn-helix transcriptional regulator [Agrobacterium vitis]